MRSLPTLVGRMTRGVDFMPRLTTSGWRAFKDEATVAKGNGSHEPAALRGNSIEVEIPFNCSTPCD